ncbi:MAG TPA: MarR family transcriptional regulator [Hyphomicrobiaceae bacterium]|nr:MarR family transcriptional regulator [Hyphomicrobiaceae bacterium]
MMKPVHPTEPDQKDERAGSALVSNRLLSLATLLRRSANLLYRRELGLSEVEWRIVAIVGDYEPLSFGALVEILGLDKGQLSRGVTALVKRRILARTADPQDSREVRIALTAHGQETFETLIGLALERNRDLVAGLPPAEIGALLAALDRLLANAKGMLSQGQAQVRRSPSRRHRRSNGNESARKS